MRVPWVFAFTAGILSAASPNTVPDSLPVVVLNYAHVSHQVVQSASNEARRAFHAAGVETDWMECSSVASCEVPLGSVQIKLLPRPVASTPVSYFGLATTAKACPHAGLCAATNVFLNRILAFADDANSPTDVTLGYVMAHEIGHILGLRHRPGGIMTAAFTADDLRRAAVGWLMFSPEDALTLRSAVAASQKYSEAAHLLPLTWLNLPPD